MGDVDALEPRMYGIEICLGQTFKIVSADDVILVSAFESCIRQLGSVCENDPLVGTIRYAEKRAEILPPA